MPFAEKLAEAIDHHRVEARRAFPHLLVMMQASALLHQRQRNVDSNGRLLADIGDYQLARHLLVGPMARQLGGCVSEPARRFLERLLEWFGSATFTTTEARKRETGSRTAAYGWLIELAAGGLVEQLSESRGSKPPTWKVADNDGGHDAAEGVLPPVEKVACGN